jgi:hypothetical protein
LLGIGDMAVPSPDASQSPDREVMGGVVTYEIHDDDLVRYVKISCSVLTLLEESCYLWDVH